MVNLDYDSVNIKKIYAFGQRSLLYTFKNEIYVGELDFKINPMKKYKQFQAMNTPIIDIAMGSEHSIILDGKHFYNFLKKFFRKRKPIRYRR